MVAEELAQRFFVVGDAMLFEECEEIGGSEAGQSRFGEVGIGGKEVVGSGVEIGEIAAASTGDENFLADAVGMFEDSDAATALGSFDGGEEAGGTGA